MKTVLMDDLHGYQGIRSIWSGSGLVVRAESGLKMRVYQYGPGSPGIRGVFPYTRSAYVSLYLSYLLLL